MSQRCRQLIRLESEGAGLALVRNSTCGINQINTVRPTCVGEFSGVSELIKHGRKFDAKFAHTRARNKCAVCFVLWACEHYFVFYVALHLPDIAGMRLGYVNDQKGDPTLILLVEFIEGRNLPPEWWSSVAAEHKHDWLLIQCRKLNPFCLI